MESRPFDVDLFSGWVETFFFDHSTERFTIDRSTDVEPLLERNKALLNATPDNWKGEWHHVASIPDVVMMQLWQEGIMTPGGRILDMPRFKHWLNDRDNQAFRTRPGRV